jgi:hypothetical protein
MPEGRAEVARRAPPYGLRIVSLMDAHCYRSPRLTLKAGRREGYKAGLTIEAIYLLSNPTVWWWVWP